MHSEDQLSPGSGSSAPPKGEGRSSGPAFELLYADLVERVMSLADDPPRCVEYLARELRELVGARTIIVYECPGMVGGARHLPVSVFPERRRELALDPRVEAFAEIAQGSERARILDAESSEPEARLLREAGLSSSLVLPLRFGALGVGSVLLLDLLDLTNEASILSTLDRLSSVLALILRNAWLYANLEREVALRTEELRAKTEELRTRVREKEVMLKEIHHRVKNNLQLVLSFLYLKSGGLGDPEARRIFEEIQNRIAAIALVHDELYRSDDLSHIDMRDYLESLVSRLLEGRPEIGCRLELECLRFRPEEAIPCGLVVNELLTNSLKHAFAGRAGGNLELLLRAEGGSALVELGDDGPGLGAALGSERPGHIGLTLVSVLAAQLHGSVEALEGRGARIRLRFPLPGADAASASVG